MSFSDSSMGEEELRQTIKIVYGNRGVTSTRNEHCDYSFENAPIFGEVPLIYTEFYSKGKKKERTRLVYISVN